MSECSKRFVIFFEKSHPILSEKKYKKPDEKEDFLAEVGAQLTTMLRVYRPIHKATLPSYSQFYLLKARGIVATDPEEHDVFDTNDNI